jgi:transcription elongation factor Elf1
MTIRCGICGRDFDTEDDLQSHTHDDEVVGVEALSCPLCGERFEGEEQLVAHQARDHVGVDAVDEDRAVP